MPVEVQECPRWLECDIWLRNPDFRMAEDGCRTLVIHVHGALWRLTCPPPDFLIELALFPASRM
jgi:hypothetical protein